MEKVIIGEILNKRIAEKGYTQQEFADLMGMKKDTLRSYMNGNSAYSYELLIEFAEKLDCSYDYLLGYSKSPKREYHELTEQTRLSNEALDKLYKYAQYYDTELEAKRYIGLLDLLIKSDGVLNAIFDYLLASNLVHGMYKDYVDICNKSLDKIPFIKNADVKNDYVMKLEELELMDVMYELKELKRAISQITVDEIKKLDAYEDYVKEIQKLKDSLNSENS